MSLDKMKNNSINQNQEQKIDFNELIKDFLVFDIEGFSNYLIYVWKDLCKRSYDTSKGINKLTFSQVRYI